MQVRYNAIALWTDITQMRYNVCALLNYITQVRYYVKFKKYIRATHGLA